VNERETASEGQYQPTPEQAMEQSSSRLAAAGEIGRLTAQLYLLNAFEESRYYSANYGLTRLSLVTIPLSVFNDPRAAVFVNERYETGLKSERNDTRVYLIDAEQNLFAGRRLVSQYRDNPSVGWISESPIETANIIRKGGDGILVRNGVRLIQEVEQQELQTVQASLIEFMQPAIKDFRRDLGRISPVDWNEKIEVHLEGTRKI